jgi:predicted house-cleaning noncanonical NTP pyrophosphatase (MazG superfamily)
MIKLNPLYLLLLIELSVILAGGLIVFLLRNRKYISLYREALKDLVGAKQAQEDLRKKLAAVRVSMPEISHNTAQIQEHKGAQEADELEGLRTKLRSVEEELKEKNHKMEQLQLKFADLEKEYMVLYQQQQSQQQQPDIP